MDEVRASVARALGQPGCRARVLVGTSGEISGAAPFRDAIRAAPADATLTVVGYARVKEKRKDKKATAERGVSASGARRSATNANAFLSPATSPGRAARNYIRENEDEETDDGFNGVAYGYPYDPLADPLAAPVGGHARASSRARSSTRARTVGTAEETRADNVVPRREKSAEDSDGSKKKRPAGRDDANPTPSAGDAMWAVLRDEAAAAAVGAAEERLGEPVEAMEVDLGGAGDPDPEPEPKPKPKPKRKRKPKEPGAPEARRDCRDRELSPGILESVPGLPPCLERIAKAYDATTAIVAFLRAQRVRSTWSQIEPAVRGAATLEDLGAAARLCPRALRLARRVVVPSAEAEETRAVERDCPGDPARTPSADRMKDMLVEVFDADARARGDAEDESFGGALDDDVRDPNTTSPMRRAVVHGSRTSRATYAVGDAENAEKAQTRKITSKNNWGRGVSGEAFAKRASAAFRAALGGLVIAEVDHLMDEEGLASDDAWARVASAGLETFTARAAVIAPRDPRAEDDARPVDAFAAPSVPARGMTKTRSETHSEKTFTKRGGGRRVCERCDALDVEAFIEHITSGPDALGARGASATGAAGDVGGCVEHRRDEPARAARFGASLVDVLSPATVAALAATGVRADALFSHQSAAIAAALRGDHVVVATGTASGKSACYNAPAFESLFGDPNATALYLFPTKALARDQLGKIDKMRAGAAERGDERYHPFDVGAYDGDTPEEERRRIFARCRMLVTNPDTLHVSLLPNHKKWRAFFGGLSVVVLDEAHAYRGVFGSHVALLLRRLRRACREVHGRDPVFVVTSATIGEPLKHAVDLVGAFPRLGVRREDGRRKEGDDDRDETRATRGWTAVTEDGSPRGAKTFLMWNPPRKDPPDAARAERLQRRGGKTSRETRVQTPLESGKRAVAERLRAERFPKAAEADETKTKTTRVDAEPSIGSVSARSKGEKTSSNPTRERLSLGRVSPIVEMAHLLVECARHDLRVIAFCKTKKLCELVLRYARELLANSNGARFLPALRAYRGGYTAGDRRATENALFDGSLRAVAATNALELGVDVGVLDATLHLGFPGSTSSLTQQAGRAGRRGKRALGVYVAFDGPLDQYFMRRPEKLFEAARKERAAIDCANPAILAAHVACAAYELPLDPRAEGVDARTYFRTEEDGERDDGGGGEGEGKKGEERMSDFRVAVDALVRDSKLARDPRVCVSRAGDLRLRWVGDAERGPAFGVSVRTIESERYRVVDVDTGATVEEIEASKAFWSVHPGAVYLNQARTFLVKSLDVIEKVARVRRADVKYFTKSVDRTWLTLVDNSGSRAAYPDRPLGGVPFARDPIGSEDAVKKNASSSAQTAACEVVIEFTGFRKVHQGTGTFFDEVSFARDMHVELPKVTFRTVASWVRVPESARRLAKAFGIAFDEAAHAASHALVNALPLLLLASHADVAAECFAAGSGAYAPRRLLLYDKHPGGVGIARRAAPVFLDLMRLALERVEACDCGEAEAEDAARGDGDEDQDQDGEGDGADLCRPVPSLSGCPGCTHYASCDHYNDGLDKRGAVLVLRETIRVEELRLRGLAAGDDEGKSGGFVDDAAMSVLG